MELYKVVNNIRKTYNPQLNNVLIFGAIGGGEKLIKYESIRQKLSNRFSIIDLLKFYKMIIINLVLQYNNLFISLACLFHYLQ
jgi:hypothetical protein